MAGLIERIDTSKSGYNSDKDQAELAVNLGDQAKKVLISGLQDIYCSQCSDYKCPIVIARNAIHIKNISRETYYNGCPIISALGLNR